MANSLMQIVSDGNLSVVPLTINFLEQAHIAVYINDVVLPTAGYSFVWSGATTITITPEVEAGLEVSIRRRTPANYVIHEFQAGAVFNERSVDENFQQELFLLQEAQEQSFITDLYDDLDMHGFRIKHLADGKEPTDAATLAQLLSVDTTAGALHLRQELQGSGGLGLIGDSAKPVTWVGFEGGADNTGTVSCKAALVAAFQQGGDITIPDGDYFIPGEGADAGGVYATITKSLRVVCSPRVRFFTDSLDNDLIRLELPSNGSGVPLEGITVDWDGGFFDQRNQKNSTVVPFMPEYPPSNPGTSATCDALSIRGFYSVGGVVTAGVKRAHVRKVVTLAGDHWQGGGGDTGVFIGGAKEQLIELCYFKSNRDLGAYPSAHESGQLNCSVTVRNCVFDTCFHGAAAKRGFKKVRFHDNTFINCVRAAQSEFISVRNQNVGILDNLMIGCGITVRMQQTDGGFIHGNTDESHGATLANGAIEPVVGLLGYLLESCSGIHIGPNTATAEKAGAALVYPTRGQGIVVTGASSGCTLYHNIFRGWRRLGSDETLGGKNTWDRNECPDGTAKYVVFTDINNGSEVRTASAMGNAPWHRTPLLCSPSANTSPIIRSYDGTGASTAGIYFAGPDIGLAGPNVLIDGNLAPTTPNTTALGSPTSPLGGGWTQAAFTVTSDERTKTRPEVISDVLLDAVADIDWVQFQIIERVIAKGDDSARWHMGVMAQQVAYVFQHHGLNVRDYAFFCYDQWAEKPAVYVEHAPVYDTLGMLMQPAWVEEVSPPIPAGELFSIRYEELYVLKMLQIERDCARRCM